MINSIQKYSKEIIDKYKRGNNCSYIAEEFTVSKSGILKFLKKNKVNIRSKSLALRRFDINEIILIK